MNKRVPPMLFRAITWAGSATLIAVAVVRWRLDDLYHTILALVLAAVIFLTEKTQQPTRTATLLLFGVLAFAVYRLVLGLALLRNS
ncbi:hypothetical protein [Deinococcus ruber]|uniref:Uncharacterized protein n=1 Tax=Deinococcus ruber TaxID=1848197 RepID=A0A918FA17_9DEIO|nr:hypothetical protein [Deinococcus ruber]GGR23471.1 hypothetical protein GCM10008957_39180 [Deinococcus ruber]